MSIGYKCLPIEQMVHSIYNKFRNTQLMEVRDAKGEEIFRVNVGNKTDIHPAFFSNLSCCLDFKNHLTPILMNFCRDSFPLPLGEGRLRVFRHDQT